MKPATWRALLAGGATAKQDEFVARLEKFEAWAKEQIAEAREYVRPRKPNGPIVNHMLDEFEMRNRTAYLVQLRLLNHVLRRLNGETPAPGCEKCVFADACFDGSVDCTRRKPS